jgi:tetratricopeptide (TPR) repeat protein
MFRKVLLHVRANAFEYLLGTIITLLALMYVIQYVSSTELWTHLKAGEWIIQHRSIPHHDIFSYTFHGKEWIDFEWLFQAIIYVTYLVLQFKGLVILQAVLIMLIIFIFYKNSILFDRGEHWITFLTLVLVLNVMKPQIVLRPQIIFLLFLVSYIYILNLYYFRNKNYLFLLPIFQVFWTNIHGSFVLGIILAGLFFLISTTQLLWANRNNINSVFKNKMLIISLAVVILLFVASLVNPYGYTIYDIPLKTAFAKEAQGFIQEWSPISLKSLFCFSFDSLLWFKVFFLLTLISFILRKENMKSIEHVAFFIIFSLMAFIHHRFAGAFGVAMGHIFVFNISNIVGNKISQKVLTYTRKWSFVILILSLSFLLLGLQKGYKNIEFSIRRGHYPQGVVQFIKEKEIKGNIFNSFDYGGFLIWHLYPQLKVFIDGRVITVYSEDFFWLHRQGLKNETVWKRLVNKYDVDIVLIDDKRDNGYRIFVKQLDDDPAWSLVAFDEVSTLYLKNKPKYEEIISLYKFKYFRPGDISLEYAISHKSKDYLQNLIQELKVIEVQYPSSFYIYHSLGLAYLLLDEPAQLENAYLYLKKALAIKPDNEFGHFNLGITLMKLKRYEEAIDEFKETITVNPNAYYYMGICYHEQGNYYRAIKVLSQYKEILGDETEKGAYGYLGLSYLRTFQPHKAVSCFLRAHYLSEPTFEIYQNLGIAYFGLKDYEKAGQYFKEALKMRPQDIKTLYNLGICYENLGRSKEALSFFQSLADVPAQMSEERNLIERVKRKIKAE